MTPDGRAAVNSFGYTVATGTIECSSCTTFDGTFGETFGGTFGKTFYGTFDGTFDGDRHRRLQLLECCIPPPEVQGMQLCRNLGCLNTTSIYFEVWLNIA